MLCIPKLFGAQIMDVSNNFYLLGSYTGALDFNKYIHGYKSIYIEV
jgi:hypothetical protein